jgi:hypothetical protein
MSDNIKLNPQTLIIIGLCIIIVSIIAYYSNSNNCEQIIIYSYDIPYIPENIRLKDKDNKITRHLKFRFVYTCPENIFNKIKNLNSDNIAEYNNIQRLFTYTKNNKKYICFFVVENTNLNVSNNIKKSITSHTYKMYDTYVMGDTRIFKDIQEILICQGYDRDKYGKNCLSTVYLNEICSNKIEYINYFIKHGLMINTTIKKYSNRPENNIYYDKYVKAPYSSRSVCAAWESVDDKCFLEDGIIVQDKNELLSKYELKCYVVDGDITMKIIRLDGRNVNTCVPDDFNEDPEIPDEAKELLIMYEDEIKKICKKTFLCMNSLVNMRITKLNNDTKYANKIINDLSNSTNISLKNKNKIKYILNGLVNSEKYKLINDINQKYHKNYDAELFTKRTSEYNDIINTNFPILDRFMRIDMAFPDGNKYDKLTITEIEPFASGIYLYATVGKCLLEQQEQQAQQAQQEQQQDNVNDFDDIVKYPLLL